MADEPSKTPGTPAERPAPQIIPLSKIHDLPGVFIPKQPDKSYGGLVSSIQASGVKEPVILRLPGGRRIPACGRIPPPQRERACQKAGHSGVCLRNDLAGGGGLPPGGSRTSPLCRSPASWSTPPPRRKRNSPPPPRTAPPPRRQGGTGHSRR